MYVQDIFDLKINIAADVKEEEVDSFQRCCRIAVEELCNVNRAEVVRKANGRSVSIVPVEHRKKANDNETVNISQSDIGTGMLSVTLLFL